MVKSNYIEIVSCKRGNYKKYINPGNLNTNREKNNRLTVRIQLVEQFAKHFPTLLSTVGTKYSSVYIFLTIQNTISKVSCFGKRYKHHYQRTKNQ